LDKIGPEGVEGELANRGIEEQARNALLQVFLPPGSRDRVASFVAGDAAGERAAANLGAIMDLAGQTSAAGKLKFDPSLARGLSYYTGAIMEINVADLAGSLGGGGRYDNLVGMFLGQNIPACGFSLGLERILVVMTERNMFPASLATTAADVMIATFDAAGAAPAIRLAAALRDTGLRVLVYPDAEKIGKQIKYADSLRVPFVALLGENEIRDNTVTVKNLARQTQDTYPQSDAGAKILEGLKQRG
jgi:histidyl-tRNA synthetase